MVKAAADAQQFAAEMELLISAEDYVEANPIVRDWIDEELVKAQARFSEMSIDELNNYIDQQVVNGQVGFEALSAITGVEPSVLIGIIGSYYYLKLAWLAAAQIARNAGYSQAATLVEHSVRGQDYYENTTLPFNQYYMSNRIVRTNAFKTYFSQVRAGKDPGWFIINKSDNKDLFYALKKVSCNSKLQGTMYTITIDDTFDFKKEDYEDLFVGLVNNWAYLCQGCFILRKVSVKIIFKQSANPLPL